MLLWFKDPASKRARLLHVRCAPVLCAQTLIKSLCPFKYSIRLKLVVPHAINKLTCWGWKAQITGFHVKPIVRRSHFKVLFWVSTHSSSAAYVNYRFMAVCVCVCVNMFVHMWWVSVWVEHFNELTTPPPFFFYERQSSPGYVYLQKNWNWNATAVRIT